MKSTPRVSFAIPTLNRERTLSACLRSIADQDYPDIEIVIVDGGSRDLTLMTASRFTSRIIHDSGSLGKARQVAFENSSGDIIAVFDSDIIIPSSDWLTNAVKNFSEGRHFGIVWSLHRAPRNASLTCRCYFALARARASRFTVSKNGEVEVIPGGNTLILRDAIEKAGGFDRHLRFGEDLELCSRIMKLGYKVSFFSEPLIHDTMWSLKEYTRKQVWAASALSETKSTRVTKLAISWSEAASGDSLGYRAIDAFKLIIVGMKAMINGLGKERDLCWIMLPILLGVRVLIYGGFFLASALRRVGIDRPNK